jgi:hypothetical protein
VGDAPTGRDDSKRRACLAAEEEEPCMPLRRNTSLLLLGIDGIEHLPPLADVIMMRFSPSTVTWGRTWLWYGRSASISASGIFSS